MLCGITVRRLFLGPEKDAKDVILRHAEPAGVEWPENALQGTGIWASARRGLAP